MPLFNRPDSDTPSMTLEGTYRVWYYTHHRELVDGGTVALVDPLNPANYVHILYLDSEKNYRSYLLGKSIEAETWQETAEYIEGALAEHGWQRKVELQQVEPPVTTELPWVECQGLPNPVTMPKPRDPQAGLQVLVRHRTNSVVYEVWTVRDNRWCTPMGWQVANYANPVYDGYVILDISNRKGA